MVFKPCPDVKAVAASAMNRQRRAEHRTVQPPFFLTRLEIPAFGYLYLNNKILFVSISWLISFYCVVS